MFRGIPRDPCFKLIRGNRIRGTNSYDQWGNSDSVSGGCSGGNSYVTEENQVIKDVAEWQKYVKVPDLTGKCPKAGKKPWKQKVSNRTRRNTLPW